MRLAGRSGTRGKSIMHGQLCSQHHRQYDVCPAGAEVNRGISVRVSMPARLTYRALEEHLVPAASK